ncbi:MAG: malate dehydrogenase (quinone) [Paraglaciecola sp.]|jgi:malate dehydrogenase (quinone)
MGVEVHLGHEVQDLIQLDNGHWKIEMENLGNGEEVKVDSEFVFIGAGGGLLRKTWEWTSDVLKLED